MPTHAVYTRGADVSPRVAGPSPRRRTVTGQRCNPSSTAWRDRARRPGRPRRCVLRLHRRGFHRHDRLEFPATAPHRAHVALTPTKDFGGVAGRSGSSASPIPVGKSELAEGISSQPGSPQVGEPHLTDPSRRSLFLASPSGIKKRPHPKPFQRNHHLRTRKSDCAQNPATILTPGRHNTETPTTISTPSPTRHTIKPPSRPQARRDTRSNHHLDP